MCAEYTLARLTDSVAEEPIDPANVTRDIQLLRSGDFHDGRLPCPAPTAMP